MKTREQFVQEYRHEIEGWMLDAAMTKRSGAELSIFLRSIRARIEAKLAAMHADLQPSPQRNGVAKP